MSGQLATVYEPKKVEREICERWASAGAFCADAGDKRKAFCIVIPPPNVTAPLHLGHALNNTLQDVLIRFRRMQQLNVLWMPGTDHAGIATQTVVEKRILAEEGRRRTDFPRDEFVARIQAWKDEYEATIINQLKMMGCSCDWDRTRFTMDEVCARAVREVFFRLYRDGLIYRGKRLVNWDPATQTVLADDEVEHEQVHGHFWYMRYPLVEPVVVRRGTGVPPVSDADILSASDEGVPPSDLPIDRRTGRFLPHWTRAGATYAVTFRLADSMPAEVLKNWAQQRQDILARAKAQGRPLSTQERKGLHKLYSARVESYLDSGRGSCFLAQPGVARVVQDAVCHFHGERYDLIAWAIMPNHVHVIFRPQEGQELARIVQSWKSFTAKEANKLLGRQGRFWMDEYYDHLIREEEDFVNEVNYVLGNPAKAGLENWPWSGTMGEYYRGQDALDTRGRDALVTRGQDGRAALIEYITIATTRPETMLGDTAVAMNPADPRAEALVGKYVRLPLVGRIIPIIADDHVVLPDSESDDEKARFSTGFLKVTPAHDPDDYAIGERHMDEIADARRETGAEGEPRPLVFVNVMAPDGTISDRHGWDDARGTEAEQLLGMDRFEAREAVVEWFRKEDLLEDVREYVHEVGHSYRSHVPIEPYLSDQWYIAVRKTIADCGLRIADWVEEHPDLIERDGELTLLKGTDVPVNSLAGFALMPLLDGRLRFVPERYAATYRAWLENLRDWPISRQLWWGHRIPVWRRKGGAIPADRPENVRDSSGTAFMTIGNSKIPVQTWGPEGAFWYVSPPPNDREMEKWFEAQGFQRDPDVLDTWFSSALWPFSTMGWPDDTPEVKAFYPGDVLCTAREIITLWVSRMVMMGQYCLGDIPFHDVFIHAMIQDGQGRKMSKSLGNGIDPLDIIDSHGADAMRFTLVSMTTQTQDVRMPVVEMKLPDGRKANTSPKFDVGRNFCNKLWNASRFVMMNLEGAPAWSDINPRADLADAWILSRLNTTVRDVTAAVEGYRFNELADVIYHFMWDDYCDWYLEIAKTRINLGQAAPKAVLAHCLDVLLRLLHPVAPFITEAVWRRLGEVAPVRGLAGGPAEPLLARARWPMADAASIDPVAEGRFELLRGLIRQVRNVRTEHNVPPVKKVGLLVRACEGADLVRDHAETIRSLATVDKIEVREIDAPPSADAAAISVGGVTAYVMGAVDREAEITRLARQAGKLAKGIAGIEKKLANEGFLTKAPDEVVQRERERLTGLKEELASVKASLEALKQ